MDVGENRPRAAALSEDRNSGRRWWTLAVVSTAQLLVVLDGTIVNIALPSAQQALGMSDGHRQWAITAYALGFGGLLLIGGRVSGALGHRRAFLIGLIGFAAASALGGAAAHESALFGARALQGVFAEHRRLAGPVDRRAVGVDRAPGGQPGNAETPPRASRSPSSSSPTTTPWWSRCHRRRPPAGGRTPSWQAGGRRTRRASCSPRRRRSAAGATAARPAAAGGHRAPRQVWPGRAVPVSRATGVSPMGRAPGWGAACA
ncbi:MFS transporter [Saccharopolyspora erythraea]|uniref:Major facilitator superfamily (MFS) profile domain-containing protein n=1 Tax=Saccharopolyspora erythraea (strain ATCC 11635 / DSM 40517 / JCM 4748 / NBRC 13426 / NCIMB 8594 / NRRL 2338) TaxID=405948 RepID=A4FDR3_SACEN|nr:MFS transporter [Saccharopolyspora erythraea]QRK92491.1 MFS transporter [Saccharopolyspora erythraea]CAM02188.1 hypothetical protein SACE_2910 [Saccharopolyspora erythraea NRRL 2338]